MRFLLTILMACCMLSLFSVDAVAQDTKFRIRSGQLQITKDGQSWQRSGPQEYSKVTGLPSYTRSSQRVYLRVPTLCRPIWLPTLNHTWRQRNYDNGHIVGDWYGGGFGVFRWAYPTHPITYPN